MRLTLSKGRGPYFADSSSMPLQRRKKKEDASATPAVPKGDYADRRTRRLTSKDCPVTVRLYSGPVAATRDTAQKGGPTSNG